MRSTKPFEPTAPTIECFVAPPPGPVDFDPDDTGTAVDEAHFRKVRRALQGRCPECGGVRQMMGMRPGPFVHRPGCAAEEIAKAIGAVDLAVRSAPLAVAAGSLPSDTEEP